MYLQLSGNEWLVPFFFSPILFCDIMESISMQKEPPPPPKLPFSAHKKQVEKKKNGLSGGGGGVDGGRW